MPMKIETEYTRIYQYCLYYLHHKEDAEDTAQETFLRYLQHPEYESHPRQYLYRIAKNICIDKIRKIRPDLLDEELTPAHDTDILTHVALRIAMNELSDEDREIIFLRYVCGEKISFIADMYGISRFVMSRRIRKITQILREKI